MIAAQFVGKPIFEINEVAEPNCPPDGMVVRVQATAVCGTDLKILRCQDVKLEKGKVNTMELPRITGHEISGVVEEVGRDTSDFQRGDRVVVAPTIPCLDCLMCQKGFHGMCENVKVIGYHLDGGFADLIKVEKDVLAAGCVVKVPDNVSLDAAALTEPLSCALNCLELSPVPRGGSVLILGPGPIGMMLADLAYYYGASQVILAGRSSAQLALVEKTAVDATIDQSTENIDQRIDELTGDAGVDLVITACPAPEAQVTALRVVSKRGTINLFGGLPRDQSIVPIDTNLIHYKEISVTGTHGSAPKHVLQSVKLQEEGVIKLDKYVGRTFPLQEINDGIKVAQSKGRLRVVIKPN